MTPTKPYLLRAIYDWALDNELTPQILVDASLEGVCVPESYVKDGQILLNVHPKAVSGLVMDNEYIAFSARFGGAKWDVMVPSTAALAIFTRENGRGIFFQPEHDETGDVSRPGETGSSDVSGPRPLSAVDNEPSRDSESGSGPEDSPSGPNRGRPNLRIVD